MTADEPRAGMEAARLLAVAQDWLRTSAPHLAPVDADGEPCSCPVCRVVATVRDADPDDVGRLVDTAVSALAGLAVQAAEVAGTVRDQAATWASAEAYEPGDADEDEPGYAVDVDDDRTDDEDDVEQAADDEADDGERRVRRITIARED